MLRSLAATLALAVAPAAQTTWYVDDYAAPGGAGVAWPSAFDALQDALGQAQSGDRIFVADGRYTPDQGVGQVQGHPKSTFVLRDGVGVYGAFLGNEPTLATRAGDVALTVLDGDLLGDDGAGGFTDNAFHVVTATGLGATTVLDGFTVRGGRATYSSGADGGGIACNDSAMRLENLVIRDNFANDDGVGMFATGASGPLVVRCTWLDNESGDVGGGIWVSGNSKGSLFVSCRFLGNTSGRIGGGVYHFGTPIGGGYYGCLFVGNHAVQSGGGMYFSTNASIPVVGCTLMENTATAPGAGIAANSVPDVRGSILWGNTVPVVTALKAQVSQGGSWVNHSVVQGLDNSMTGVGLLGGDPLLLDLDGPDDVLGTLDDSPRLAPGSPCVDAGDGTAFASDAPDLDLDGDVAEPLPLDLLEEPRFADDPAAADVGVAGPGLAVPDMGCSERFDPQPLSGSPGTLSIQDGGVQTLFLAAPAEHAGKLYLLMGTEIGDTPGLPFGSIVLPLNPGPYWLHSLTNPNAPPLSNSFGTLDASAGAQATFTLPPLALDPAFAGAVLHHAYAVLDTTGPTPTVPYASNAWPVTLGP